MKAGQNLILNTNNQDWKVNPWQTRNLYQWGQSIDNEGVKRQLYLQ